MKIKFYKTSSIEFNEYIYIRYDKNGHVIVKITTYIQKFYYKTVNN